MYRVAVLRSGEVGPPFDVAQAYVDGDKMSPEERLAYAKTKNINPATVPLAVYYVQRVDGESGDPYLDLKTPEEMHEGVPSPEPEPPQAA
jgi:hypothetical protein